MIGELTKIEIEQVLQTEVFGRIGCCDQGVAYVVPTSYAYEGGTIYAHTNKGMKIDIMRKNPTVCFEVDHLEHMSHWKSVIGWGQFKEITNPEQRKQALQILLRRKLPLLPSQTVKIINAWPFGHHDTSGIEGIVYSITLDKKSGRYEDDQQSPSFAG